MLTYKVVNIKMPHSEQEKFGAQPRPVQVVSLTHIAGIISSQCTLMAHEIRGVLSAMEEQIYIALRNIRSVRLGGISGTESLDNKKP